MSKAIWQFCFLLFIHFIASIDSVQQYIKSNDNWKAIEARILHNYNRKHRPVKKESTTTSVKIIMKINHIEDIVSLAFFAQTIKHRLICAKLNSRFIGFF